MNDSIRVNGKFIITSAIPVGSKEFVLGVHQKNPKSFVTWECKGGTDYYWGHYTDNLLKATMDLCQRAMEEVEYLQQWEQKRDAESRYRILATVKYGCNTAVVQFPTKELGSTLESIGVTLPPERVYLSAMRDVEVQFQHEGNHVVDALIHLFKDNNSLRMVNEVAKAVFHSDWRVYERVEEKLKTDSYSDVENLLRDAVDYSKYLKDKERHGRGDR